MDHSPRDILRVGGLTLLGLVLIAVLAVGAYFVFLIYSFQRDLDEQPRRMALLTTCERSWRTGDAAAVLPVCTQATQQLKGYPDAPRAHMLRALVLVDLGRLDEALAAADEAVGLGPGWVSVSHATRGYVLLRMERCQEAIAAYEAGSAPKQGPWPESVEDAKASLGLGLARTGAGQHDLARADLNRGLEQGSKWSSEVDPQLTYLLAAAREVSARSEFSL